NRRLLPVGLLPSLLVSASLPATLYLLEPEIPPGVYYGQWMAEFGQLATYDGVLHDARVGSLPLPDRRLDESAVDGIRNISARSPLHIDFTAAPAPPSLAPILSVFDRRQAVLLLVGVEADAVVVHLRRRARTYRFRAPALRYREFHPAVGSRVTLDVRRQDGAICLDHDGTSSCRPLAAPGRSWSLLLGSAPATLPEGLLDGVWLALLGLFAVAACSILPSSIGRGVQALVLGLPAVTYVTLWLLAGDGGWLPGLAGLVLGSAAWMHRLRRSTVGSC
ncbi:MAG: hypothetical protein OEM23_04235, partial [Gemmatimonadota bacterium]|nr:hypothetical protein [Gemmatimonadota bacterium]